MRWTEPRPAPLLVRRTPSELRRFGVVMAGAFGVIGGFLLWKGSAAAPWLLALAGAFVLAGLAVPRALAPVERRWIALGHRLSVVSSYVLLTLVFFLAVTPLALLARLVGRDRLRLRRGSREDTFWVPVEEDGPAGRPDRPY